jgi:hypothetical protein
MSIVVVAVLTKVCSTCLYSISPTVSGSSDSTQSPIWMSSMFFVPSRVIISVPATKHSVGVVLAGFIIRLGSVIVGASPGGNNRLGSVMTEVFPGGSNRLGALLLGRVSTTINGSIHIHHATQHMNSQNSSLFTIGS